MARFAPRLHVLLASDAPVGVVIRRGPSKQVCTVLWNRRTDEFRVGQWLKGRIYERRSDLSSDGRYLIYFAMNGHWESEAKGAWTAISKAPYLKALAMLPKGDCWHGGGLFTGKVSYWLNDGCGHSVLRNTREVWRDKKFQPSENFGGECQGVYYPRLLRDGWKLVGRVGETELKGFDTFEKPLPHGWTLRKLAHAEVGAPQGKSVYWDEHELRHASGERVPCPDWEWAEVDGNRLAWAKGGKLFAGKVRKKGITTESELFDFNELTFEPIEAPY